MEYSWTNSQIEDPCVDDPIKIRDRNWEEKDGLLGVCQSNIGSGPTFGVPKNNILHVHIHEFHRSMWCIFKYNIMVWPVFCHCSQLPLVAWGWCTRDQLMMMYNNNRPVVDQLITAKTHAGLFREHPDMPNDASMTLYYAPCMKLVAATHVPHYNFITCVTFESHETITVVDQQFSCMQPRWWQSSAILTKTSQKTELSLGLKEILTQNQRLAIQQNAFDMNKFFPTHSYISHIYISYICSWCRLRSTWSQTAPTCWTMWPTNPVPFPSLLVPKAMAMAPLGRATKVRPQIFPRMNGSRGQKRSPTLIWCYHRGHVDVSYSHHISWEHFFGIYPFCGRGLQAWGWLWMAGLPS